MKKRTNLEKALMEIRDILRKGTNKHGIPIENIHKTLDFIKQRLKKIRKT